MANRREFLQTGIAAASLPIVASAFDLLPAALAAPTPLYKLVVDERFPAGVTFGTAAKGRGISVHWIKGDVTELWFHDLDLRWKKAPVAIAGLTQESSLFCLELLARDRGLRLMHRTEHEAGSDGCLEPAVEDLWNWSWQLSATALQTSLPKLADNPSRLFSWVIAPKSIRAALETR